MLVRLIYASHTAKLIEPKDIQSILDAARIYNAQHDITGLLCQGNSRFVQYIEGSRDRINELYAKIMRDDRHREIVLLDYTPIEIRGFQEWSMGFLDVTNERIAQAIKESIGLHDFHPEHLSAADSVQLMGILKNYIKPRFVVHPDPFASHQSGRLH